MMIYKLTATKIVLDEKQGLYIMVIDNGIFANMRYENYIGFEDTGDLIYLYGCNDEITSEECMSLYLTGYFDTWIEDNFPENLDKFQERKAELWKEELT